MASAGAGIAAAAKGGPDMPDPRNYAQETRDTMLAKLELAPRQFASEQEYRPRYNQLEFDEQMAFLLGRPGGQREQEYTEYVTQKKEGTGRTIMDPKNRTSRYIPEEFEKVPVTRRKMVDVPASRGFLDLLEQDISPKLRSIQTADRAGEIEDVKNLGPKAMEALRAANPGAAAIVDSMIEEAGANARGELGAGERRDIQQAIREGQGARGVGFGPRDVFDEVYGSGIASRELAFNKGIRALGASQGFYGEPFERVLGKPSSAGASGGLMALAGQNNAAAGPRLFDPESAYAGDIFSTNFNAQSAASISARNNRAAMAGSLMGVGGSLGGGYLAGRY